MFGHQLDEPAKDGKDSKDAAVPGGNASAEGQPESKRSGEQKGDPAQEGPEVEMGRFLPFLQDLVNFVQRCYSLTKNCIHQLACLYHERCAALIVWL